MSGLLFNAFRALGPGATRREIAQVAAALRESGDEDVGRLLNYEEDPQDWTGAARLPTGPALTGSSRLTLRSRSTTRSGSPGSLGAKTSTCYGPFEFPAGQL
jgi:hypothetical protein